VAARTAVAWDDALTDYDFGAGHPLAPVRVELTMALAREFGLLEDVEVLAVQPADQEELSLVHTAEYIAAVRAAGGGRPDYQHGLGSPDNPVFDGMHEASALVVGASLAAARAVWQGGQEHGVNVAGGLHHAMASMASGFCVYNDPAIAIAWLLAHGANRVAYVDIDVHHGDGVQAAFYHDPRVLTISVHESGRYLFPGSGFPDEVGREGSSVNVALPPGTDDAGWLRAFHAVVPPLLRGFGPDILVSQHGCDTHAADPLAHLKLSVDGQRRAHMALHDLAHETADGRWLALGGGGYELVHVVPRTWTHLIATAAGRPIDVTAQTPARWQDLVQKRAGTVAPAVMTDGMPAEYEAWRPGPGDNQVDQAILATREAVFPLRGLDPLAPA
jgi:acetoin utilization protein AcuC